MKTPTLNTAAASIIVAAYARISRGDCLLLEHDPTTYRLDNGSRPRMTLTTVLRRAAGMSAVNEAPLHRAARALAQVVTGQVHASPWEALATVQAAAATDGTTVDDVLGWLADTATYLTTPRRVFGGPCDGMLWPWWDDTGALPKFAPLGGGWVVARNVAEEDHDPLTDHAAPVTLLSRRRLHVHAPRSGEAAVYLPVSVMDPDTLRPGRPTILEAWIYCSTADLGLHAPDLTQMQQVLGAVSVFGWMAGK